MTRADRALTLVVALVCAFALGAAGTSLEAAVHTSPDDVIDVDRTGLPISENQARQVRDQVESKQDEPSREEAQQNQDDQQQQQKKQQQQQQQQQQSQSASPDEPSLWQQLLALLRALFPYLLGALLLGLLALVVYRKRDRLLALLALLLDGSDEREDEPPAREHRPLALSPENDVDDAWLRLARAVGDRAGGARTPREYETAAVQAGFDPDAVSQVTRIFEEVRYGGQPVTDDRRRRANDALARLGLGGGAR